MGSFADLDPRDPATIAYACSDADVALRLYQLEIDWFGNNIPAHAGLIKALESPVALFTARMEHRGVLADKTQIVAAAAGCREQLGIYQQQLEIIGSRPVKVGQNAATNVLKAYLFGDLGLPILKRTDTGKASLDAEAILGLSDYCAGNRQRNNWLIWRRSRPTRG